MSRAGLVKTVLRPAILEVTGKVINDIVSMDETWQACSYEMMALDEAKAGSGSKAVMFSTFKVGLKRGIHYSVK
jgi:hypothetical protein